MLHVACVPRRTSLMMTQTHPTEPIFVGRQAELRRFGEIIADPTGQAVLVVGQEGMGKTLLVNRMARMARDHPNLKCGTVRYAVPKTDDVAGTMELMMEQAFEAARVGEKFLSGTDRQWSALFKAVGLLGDALVAPLVGKAAETIGDLALSLKRDPTKDTRTQFVERLRYISEKMPHDGRAVFIIDPEKYMKDDSHDAWRLVVKDLPDKIKFLFAQRPDDVLVTSSDFTALPNVERVPDEALEVLSEQEVDDLIQASASTITRSAAEGEGEVDVEPVPSRAETPSRARKEADETSQAQVMPEADVTPEAAAKPEADKTPEARTAPHDRSLTVAARIETTASEGVRSSPGNAIRATLARYEGHPYATAAALNLLADGATIADLPADPTPSDVAAAQSRRLCDEHKENAVKLFEGYAILEVPVPDEVVDAVSEVDAAARKALTANAYVAGLLRTEPDGTRIYHSLFADHICTQISDPEAKIYHTRAINTYRRRLTANAKPDALAAVRLPEHVLAVEGGRAFITSFVNECFAPLRSLGLLDAALAMSKRTLDEYVTSGSELEAVITGNLGLIYRSRGDLDEAERMHLRSLEFDQKHGRLQGIADQYSNLGGVSQTRGDLDEAEQMHRSALRINEKLGRLEGMACNYSNLGLIFQVRGNLVEAENWLNKSLEIEEKLGRLEGVAATYGNLGNVSLRRGELDQARTMYVRALKINEKLGHLEGIATNYSNLGHVSSASGDLDNAVKMHRRALEIETRLGRPEGLANQYGNLGNILQARGDLDAAENMYGWVLEIEQGLGRLVSTALVYGNLGSILLRRGDLDGAEDLLSKGLEIDKKLGRLEGMASKYGKLGLVAEKRGSVDDAFKLYTRARDLFAKIGMPQMVEEHQRRIDDLPDAGRERT